MIKHDFPGQWPDAVIKIDEYLKSDNLACCMAGIMGFSSLVKAFEYQKADKSPINGAVKILLPDLYSVMFTLVQSTTVEAVVLQKIITKSYFKLVQVRTH